MKLYYIFIFAILWLPLSIPLTNKLFEHFYFSIIYWSGCPTVSITSEYISAAHRQLMVTHHW